MSLALLIMALGVYLAALVNGATGLGFAIVGTAALALLLDARTAIIMLSVMVPFLSSLQLWRHRAQVKHVRRVLPLLASTLLGVPLGTYLLTILPVQGITVLLGIFTLLYVVSGFLKLRFSVSPRWEPVLSPVVGFTAGTLSGSIGATGPLLASYLLALEVPAATFVFSLALMFVTNSSTRLVGLVALGQLTSGLLGLALLLVVPAVLGLFTGMWLQGRLPKQGFQRAVLLVLAVAGANLVIRGLS